MKQILQFFHLIQRMPMQWLLLLAGAFGLLIGSFLNVVIIRFLDGGVRSLWHRSRCMSCGRQLVWWELIPVFSWIFLKGSCRSCKAPISIQYPLVEMMISAVAMVIFLRFGFTGAAVEQFLFCSLLLTISFIDARTWLIPLSLCFMLLFFGLFFGWLKGDWMLRAQGALGGFSFLALILLVFTWIFRQSGRIDATQTAMGWGDPWLMAGIGAFVGLFNVMWVVFIGSVAGLLGFLVLWVAKTHFRMGAELPTAFTPPHNAIAFGPFLCLGAFCTQFLGHYFHHGVRIFASYLID